MSQYIVLFLLFFLPLIFIPNLPFGFEQPKVILAELTIELLLFLMLVKYGLKFTKKLNKTHLFLICSLFLLTIIQLILNPKNINLFGNLFRLQGLWMFWHLLLFSLISSLINIDLKKHRHLYLFPLFSITIFAAFLGQNLSSRSIGTLGEPNALAATTLFFISFIALTQNNLIKLLVLISSTITLHLTRSNSAALAFIIQAIFYCLVRFTKIQTTKAFLLCLSLVFSLLILPFFNQTQSVENRSAIWKLALYTGLNSPLIGHGFGSIQNVLEISAKTIPGELKNLSVDSSHNLILDLFLQGGLLGLGLFVILITISLRNLLKKNQHLELIAFLGIFTMSLFNPISVVNLLALWWVISRGFQKN